MPRGGRSCYWDYAHSFGRRPFRTVICLSPDDAVLHGRPRDQILRDGDVLTLDAGGHGLGRTMHEGPHVSNRGRAGKGLRLRPGMTLALEPWWSRGGPDLVVDADGRTLRAADGSMTAHSEHTIAVTDDGTPRADRTRRLTPSQAPAVPTCDRVSSAGTAVSLRRPVRMRRSTVVANCDSPELMMIMTTATTTRAGR